MIAYIKKDAFNIAASREEMVKTISEMTRSLLHRANHSQPSLAAAIQIGVTLLWRLRETIKFFASDDPNAVAFLNALIGNSLTTKKDVVVKHPDKKRRKLNKGQEQALQTSKSSAAAVTQENLNSKIAIIRYVELEGLPINIRNVPLEEHQAWLTDNLPGYAILAVNLQGVHAELRIIDCLIAAGIITFNSQEKIYMGTSWRCCLDCAAVIIAINQTIDTEKQKKFEIHFSESHYRSFDNWNKKQPFFLKARPERGKREEITKEIEQKLELIANFIEKTDEIRRTIEREGSAYMSQTSRGNPAAISSGTPPLLGSPEVGLAQPLSSSSYTLNPMPRAVLSSTTTDKAVFNGLADSLTNMLTSVRGWPSNITVSREELHEVLSVLHDLEDAINERCSVETSPSASMDNPK